MTKIVLSLGLAAFLLSGCTGRFIGTSMCDPKGAVVWFQQPDAQGQYKEGVFTEANCNRR
jgi:hypothetical protein